MKSCTHYLTFNTRQRRERARMTDEVRILPSLGAERGQDPQRHLDVLAARQPHRKDATTSCLSGAFSMSRSSGSGLPSASPQISAVSSRSDGPGSCLAQSGRG